LFEGWGFSSERNDAAAAPVGVFFSLQPAANKYSTINLTIVEINMKVMFNNEDIFDLQIRF
jgi:hypothetical protein